MKKSGVKLKRPLMTSGALGSLALVLGAVLLVLRSIPQEGWAIVVILALSAGLIGGREWLAKREVADEIERERLAALRCPPCAVRDCNPFALGVTPSEIADRFRGAAARPPYVSRDVDAELDRLLRDSFFVALVGPSKAGKSRTAFEAISRVFPRRALIAPEMPGFARDGMAAAVAAYIDSASEGAVIWLDDLQEYLQAKAIATQDLNAWRVAHQKVIVVATIRDGELAAMRGSGLDVERIVDQAKMVSLPPLLSHREIEDAKAAYPAEDFGDGIGVHLVAGQRLVERLVSGREANPAGYAITCAAIDRRRAGVSEPAKSDELIELAHEYLHEVQPRSNLSQEMAAEGLAWAAEPVIQDIGLLLRRGPDGDVFEPFEYVVAYRDGEVGGGGQATIPPATVNALINRHDGWDLHAIGFAAMVRRDIEPAIRALKKVAQDPDPHIAAHGLEELGKALLYIGEDVEGQLRTEEAAACDYPCVIAPASFRLARKLAGKDDDKAELMYRQVLEYPSSWAYPKALVNLGLVLRTKTSVQSDRNEHGVQFRSQDSSELSEHDLRLEDEAREMFKAAIESDDREARANGGMALGVLLESRGEQEEAIEAYKAGVDAGSYQARITLAEIHAEDAETLELAKELIDEIDESQMRADSAVYRHRASAKIASNAGVIDGEIKDLRRALETNALPYSLESAQMHLAIFLIHREQPEDVEEIRAHLQQVIDSGSDFAPEAESLLSSFEEFLATDMTD